MQRPSGMTALAVLSFIIAGVSLLVAIGQLAALGQLETLERAARQTNTAVDTLRTLIYVEAAASLLDVALLIPAGIGYLRQQRFMGRLLGSIYGVLGIVYFIVVTWILVSAGGLFSLAKLSSLVFPAVTLVMVNVVFRENFIR